MKLIFGPCAAGACAGSLSAQSPETTRSKTKVKVDGGKDVEVIGCVQENPGGGFMLTDSTRDRRYALVGGENLDKQLGHRVEIKGKATSRDHGKVKIETKEKSSNADTTHDKTDVKDVYALSVKSVKKLSDSCR